MGGYVSEPRRGRAGVGADDERHRRRVLGPAQIGVGRGLQGVGVRAGLRDRRLHGEAVDDPAEGVAARST